MTKMKVERGYVRARLGEYPDLAEFVDAYYWHRRGRPQDMDAYLAKIDAIKARFPKAAPTPAPEPVKPGKGNSK